jgi:hypothetical protein
MLRSLQRAFSELYDLELEIDIDDFVCSADLARAVAGDDEVSRGELLLVGPRGDDVELGVYVDGAAIATLAEGGGILAPRRFAAFCLAAEGVSHFLYVVFRATHEETVSLFELELQGEIDKYALAVLSAGPSPRLARSRLVRHALFAAARFRDGASDVGLRYRRANRLAARYAAHLESHLRRGDTGGFSAELRRFYRLGGAGKVEHIDRCCAEPAYVSVA